LKGSFFIVGMQRHGYLQRFQVSNDVRAKRAFYFDRRLNLLMAQLRELFVQVFNLAGIVGVYTDIILFAHLGFVVAHNV
jgi:hypothetical protein